MHPNASPAFRNPRGLIYGLLSVALGQIFLVIPYYYLLRKRYIKRPFIQIQSEVEYNNDNEKGKERTTFFDEMKNQIIFA